MPTGTGRVASSGYGLALYTGTHNGVRQVSHGGLLESYNCFLRLFPDRQVGVIVQSNYDADDRLGALVDRISDDLLGSQRAAVGPAAVPDTPAAWSRHTGTYLSVHAGLAEVGIAGDHLVLERNGDATPLTAVEGGLYHAHDSTVGLVPEADGPTQFIMIDSQPYGRFEPNPAYVPNPAVWEAYAGTYAEWVIDPYPLHVRIVDRQLRLKWWGEEVICTPLSDTSFVSSYGVIEFEVGADGDAPVLITAKAARQYRTEPAA